MPRNLGRDEMWPLHIWGEIDKAVQEEVDCIRVAQKVFPTLTLDGAQTVPVDVPVPDSATMTVPELRRNKHGKREK